MAKNIEGYIKLQIPAGQANPSPPVGPALGQRGLNIMEFCKAFNAATDSMEKGMPIPVEITAYSDKSFTFMEEAQDAPLNDGHMWPNTWDVLATRHKGKGNGWGVNGQGDRKEVAGLGNILMGDARVEPWTKQKFLKFGYQKGNSRLWKPYGKVSQPSP